MPCQCVSVYLCAPAGRRVFVIAYAADGVSMSRGGCQVPLCVNVTWWMSGTAVSLQCQTRMDGPAV